MKWLSPVLAVVLVMAASVADADSLSCGLEGYKAQPGLIATSTGGALTVQWTGDRSQELRIRFAVLSGTPTIQSLEVRRTGGQWDALASNVVPEYRVASGLRRMSNQQMVPLRGLGVELTSEIVDRYRWDPFWDAPLDLSPPANRSSNPPPAAGVANQPGLPRKADEITRAAAVYRVSACTVKTDGLRLAVIFPGVQLGVFSGALHYTFFKGTNLIQQELVAATSTPWVAYKYHTGLKGLATSGARVVWKDIANTWQEYRFGGARNDDEVPLKAASRIVVAENRAGSIAIFPPPHNFFWAREIAINLGYNFYRKDSETAFAFGIRQAEHEDESENQANFALYSARPGTEQRMTVFLYPTADNAEVAFDRVAAFTHGDHYKPLPGYQVMNHHYHMDLGRRLGDAGSLDADIPDLVALKALGINIVSQIDSVGLGAENPPVGAVYPGGRPVMPRTEPAAAAPGASPAAAAPTRPRVDELQIRFNSIEGAKRHSDTNFLVLPSQEYYGSPLGGHTDLLFSHPVYWEAGRTPGQALTDTHPKYGTVYHLGGADDLMEMARREQMLITMPHPRTKGSTGFPDSIRHLAYFNDPLYQGVGFRWGMGLDRSEQRLCEYRCLALLDDMSNWLADASIPLKYLLSISEVRHQQPGDDIYASSPVSYVKLDTLPSPDDVSPLITTLMRGDYFVSSGEVLIPSYRVSGTGTKRTIEADVEWTFPLAFVEVVWGDGVATNREIVSAADLAPAGTHRFSIPVDTAGKKWIRFAAWDVAGNGALVQPVRLFSTPQSTTAR